MLHVDFNTLVNAVILQGANQFQAGPVTYVSKSRITVTAEIALQNSSVCGTVEHCAPGLKFADPFGCFLGMQFGHSPVVDVLTAPHRVGEMNFPVVAVIHICERGGHTAFSHHRMRLAEKRFANQSNPNTGG